MDLPDAASVDRNRGLPLAPSPPSVRLYIASKPWDDPSKRDRSACAFVVSRSDNEAEYLSSPLPARPGTQLLASTVGETINGAASPQLSANVGLHLSSVSNGMQRDKCLQSRDGTRAMSTDYDYTLTHATDDDSVLTQYQATQQSLNARHAMLHSGERQQQETQHNPGQSFGERDTGYLSGNLN